MTTNNTAAKPSLWRNPANAPLGKLISFYVRFTPSYSKIGYHARSLFWRSLKPDFRGQTWLVIGGSEGIGGSAARSAVNAGARLISVGRSAEKLAAFAQSTDHPENVQAEVADFSLRSQVWALLDRLQAQGVKIDVLVNNVGIQKRDQIITQEGLETSFVTNILSHYIFTREALSRGLLKDDATVIETASGGMYNHPLVVKDLNIASANHTPAYLGVRAYGLSKRAQVVLTQYWRRKFAGTGRRFYVMHPGWVDTAAVGRSMPRFRETLKSVLRSDPQGADTIVYLAAKRPDQQSEESIWFDRKERTAHIFPRTRATTDTPESLVAALETYSNRS
ncbi:SDR family NAD(P)-dependent oxidoreductase [Hydrogenophaga sp. BPS33]|uniref:SDR family NAD(P)-dependent oxidoreductase n=1 Tax=Hydrogenophaga sp. BPS33 TaxID=2651974 RepID=UPI00131F9546|nr:SDR family NAD(P)-dependent oxidoreductase [Hydrogenophaga sp. BPS33]QHE87403.1 SDR family NAD(P)-dependent oxidoreductase [Hydrogenophaga sp. BPS33]